MEKHWRLDTHGDPLGAIRLLLRSVWEEARLDGMFASVGTNGALETRLRLLREPSELSQTNPFRPLMTRSVAREIPALLAAHAGESLGVLVRPCEMRALVEMVKHDSLRIDGLLTVCVDCLATLPSEEFAWRSRRHEHRSGPADEALLYAGRGGIVPYRYRSACQMCRSPEARSADVNVGVLGMDVRQDILVSVSESSSAASLRMGALCDGVADDAAVTHRAAVLAHMGERQARARERITAGLAAGLPTSSEGVVRLLEGCGACQACRSACPICAVDAPRPGADGNYATQDVSRWLISCDGCGMCEQACPNQLPLTAMFGAVHDRLTLTTGYVAGRSIREPLPI